MFHSLALKNDGTVWAWGSDIYGQLGDGGNSTQPVPVQVSSLTNVIAITAGQTSSYALKNDGTVWSWGGNSSGQLGDNSGSNQNVPVQVTNIWGGSIIAIAAGPGGNHALLEKSDGTVWTFGSDASGQLGDGGANANQPTAVQATPLCSVIMPVELLYFTANCENKNAKLNWATGSEQNCDFFSVERSNDGISFSPIGIVAGSGNSSTEKKYSYTDNEPSSGISYYRLKEVDYDKKYEYSSFREINVKSFGEINIYPNPCTDNFFLESKEAGEIKITVADLSGRETVNRTEIFDNAAVRKINIPDLASGVYAVHIFAKSTEKIQRLIVIK